MGGILYKHVPVRVLSIVLESRNDSREPDFHLFQNKLGTSAERSLCWDRYKLWVAEVEIRLSAIRSRDVCVNTD